jgi:hypothetical protein
VRESGALGLTSVATLCFSTCIGYLIVRAESGRGNFIRG